MAEAPPNSPTAADAPTRVGAPRPGRPPAPADRRRAQLIWALIGAALLLLGLGAILVASAFGSDPEARALGGNLPINPGARDAADISAHNSPTIARNPTDGQNLAVANRIDTPRFSCALQVSFNAGSNWSQTPIPTPPGERLCYAPDVAFGADGTLYYTFVTLRGRANAPNAAWLATSRDGGQTLSEPVRIGPLGPLSFQVRLVADPEVPRRLYVTWLQAREVALFKFPAAGNPIQFTRTDDGGRSWKPPTRVSPPARGRSLAPVAAAGPDGELYVLYLDLRDDVLDYEGAHEGRGGPPWPRPWQLVLARSRDRGAKWEESVVESRLVPAERFIAFTPPFPSLAVDPDSGKVYAGFHDRRHGDADVLVWSLEPGERDWKGPVRVNDTPPRDRTSQYLPRLAVAPSGRLDVVYYDRREDRANVMNQVSLQSSFDGGEGFTERIRLSDRAFSSRIGYGSERGMPDLGSRLGLISTDDRAFAVWSDTRAGNPASNKQDLGRGVAAFSDPPSLPSVVRWLLFIGGALLALLGLGLLAAAAAGPERLGGRVPLLR